VNKETDLSSQWLEVWQLRRWAKGKLAEKLNMRMEDVEKQMFSGAEDRIDEHWRKLKRGDNYKK
jgi:hypothetical protein